jgi:hypothetical protein
MIKVVVDFHDRNFDSEVLFRFIFFQVFDKFTEITSFNIIDECDFPENCECIHDSRSEIRLRRCLCTCLFVYTI